MSIELNKPVPGLQDVGFELALREAESSHPTPVDSRKTSLIARQ